MSQNILILLMEFFYLFEKIILVCKTFNTQPIMTIVVISEINWVFTIPILKDRRIEVKDGSKSRVCENLIKER